VLRIGALATLSRNFQIKFLEPLIGRDDVEVVLCSDTQATRLRALEALTIDVLLTNPVPARDAVSPSLVRRIAQQPVSLIGARASGAGGAGAAEAARHRAADPADAPPARAQ